MSDKINKIYEERFKPAYERADLDRACVILLENSKVKDCLSKEELRGMMDYYELSILNFMDRTLNSGLESLSNKMDKCIKELK